MEKYKIISGDELVARGTTKTDASLPEVGLKDVLPNGSWLEQKQIQSALEARKHLIEVERIEKCGVLSHAEWKEELMLAEVTQKAGGHWQYLGHNVGKHLYLNPEEALFLMEVNCLQLKHKDVTVSIQQAYSLLLRGKITILQYRVYSSLSRLGYKVYRHEYNQQTEYEKRINLPQCKKRIKDNSNESEEDGNGVSEVMDVSHEDGVMVTEASNAVSSSSNVENVKEKVVAEENMDKTESETVNNMESNAVVGQNCSKDDSEMETQSAEISNGDINPSTSETSMEISESQSTTLDIVTQHTSSDENIRNSGPLIYQNKLQTILDRKLKPINANTLEKCFKNVPDLTEKNIVTVNIPEEQYIPRNVFLNNMNYELNLERIRSRTRSSRSSTESRPYSSNEEVNGLHIRRIRDSLPNNTDRNNWQSNPIPNRYTEQNFQYRPPFWRPQMNFFPYIMFQRPFMPMLNTLPRFRLSFPRSLPPLRMLPRLPNVNDNRLPNQYRKRRRSNTKQVHLQAIKNVAAKLKQLISNSPVGVPQDQNIEAIQRLINTFNARYNTTIKLTSEFDISTNDERIIETISLDDDEATNSKRSRSENDVTQSENLDKLKYLASKLKDMENSEKANSRHRRAFSQLLKKFNNTYKTDVYLNSNFEVVDRRYIKLDSSSDSDCVIDDTPKTASGKKLKNPFSILKQLAQKSPTATKVNEQKNTEDTNKYTDDLKLNFGNWLPNEQDFGKAEIFPQNLEKPFLLETKREEYIFEFINSQPYEFENWLDIKTSFLKHVADTSVMMQTETPTLNDSMPSLINPEDCTDTASVLKKLSIIKRNNKVNDESTLAVDFDVYNRDVQNFKKTSRPKPHFRIVCIDEHTSPPSGAEIATLHSKYEDNVSILFAVVGSGSISYLQMNPYDLPVYIPSGDLT